MDEKSLKALELFSILERLAGRTSFSGGRELALQLAPSSDPQEVLRRLQETSQARRLLATREGISLGGAREIRPLVEAARKGARLSPNDLLQIRATLSAARSLNRALTRASQEAPLLADIGSRLHDSPQVSSSIDRALDQEGKVLDQASQRLADLRGELGRTHERLMARLQHLLGEHAAHLQESLITQREGRYVVPLRSEFKGRLRGIVHDQSASGATLFIEPLATVEMNNRLRELQLLEQEEVERILSELSGMVASHGEEMSESAEALAQVDLILAKADLAEAMGACEPALVGWASGTEARAHSQPPAPGPSPLTLLGARHPLLDPATVVPIDLVLRPGVSALVITGPNTGGKTVALKTAGLLAAMAQCGLHIPAEPGSELTVFDSLLADIGDEQSIQQSLSTFSAHIQQIVRILRMASSLSLVILDELGAGTDPQEGSALARAILSELIRRRIPTLVATHYPELKSFAYSHEGAENASVEFDPNTFLPTYHLALGVPGRSNALSIAGRLGLNPPILQEAREMVSSSDLQVEQLLEEIQRERDALRAERKQAAAARREVSQREQDLARHLSRIEDERERLIEEARRQAAREVNEVRSELREVRRTLQNLSSANKAALLTQSQDKLEQLEKGLEEAAPPVELPGVGGGRGVPQIGDRVRLRRLGMTGQLVARSGDQVEVQAGMLRIRAELRDLERQETAQPEAPTPPGSLAESSLEVPSFPSPGIELDLRGKTVEEATLEIERYLDAAFAAKLPWVRIIHGKGSGRLRKAVRELLGHHPLVASTDIAAENEGGEGVTLVNLQA
ncbi:MAG: endonuclease MutS2 [Anaerolineales bacterium]|jgi:DNA mismatch repair protein MutS2